MGRIELKGISKFFKEEEVIKDLDLTIRDGSFTVLVGPSGCGKSTTLRMIAGLDEQTKGEIWIDDMCVNGVAPGNRDVAMVFQNYALYPTMNVYDNIEFGLVNRKVPKKEREKLIKDIAEIVGLSDYMKKKPEMLSGGQRQRVALARAMVKKPQVFILDEPLSNLDAKLRHQMRTELIQLHKRLGTTFVYVTHDQVEAMSMGDEIVIMNKGVIQQAASPMTLYNDPANVFAAQFIGTPAMNVLPYKGFKLHSAQGKSQDIASFGFRPEHALLNPQDSSSEGLRLDGEVMTRESLGAENIYQIGSPFGMFSIKTFLEPLVPDNRVSITVPYERLYYFNTEGQRLKQYEIRQGNEGTKPNAPELISIGGGL
ncbi:ABC transporter ATP-binding protein [Paenibacillus urinalis]|uniref:ABC transporter ATP-binding protein n=1 Tax=Paenibacillus urinalis TaxID=521520 RepID=A0AAX3N1Z3_9BACL|nr:ABC transporter ATP-binding protein [Paenibacillus urinalis]WDH83607.1 ABC transporter ATP-binding protein [Paenibacillus urinalis]WDH99635.1 ABC transporter ATP-binding protein [Paenibacillus urinalis]WDI03268.1 ABC transporter ATP-binding protein [Paenibacillus urinalis]